MKFLRKMLFCLDMTPRRSTRLQQRQKTPELSAYKAREPTIIVTSPQKKKKDPVQLKIKVFFFNLGVIKIFFL